MIFGRSRIHDLDIFQPVNRSCIKKLIKVLNRHISQFAINNNGHVRRPRKPDHAVVIYNPRHIAKSFENVSDRLLLYDCGQVDDHNAIFPFYLRFLSFDYHLIKHFPRDGICHFSLSINGCCK